MPRAVRNKVQKPKHKHNRTRVVKKQKARLTTLWLQLILILVAVFCAFLVVQAHILAASLSDTSPLVKPYVTVASAKQTDDKQFRTQSNPLFASRPSWFQDFSDDTNNYLNPAYWTVLVGPAKNANQEAQYYTGDISNLTIKDGALYITAKHESKPDGYEYTSARIETQNKISFLYGRMDIIAKLPSGVGTWPAVWMLPADNTYANLTPNNPLRYKNGGEIDIIEAVGFEPNVVYGVAHTLSDKANHPDGTGSYKAVNVPNNDKEFVTYSLLWTPNDITFCVNNEVYFTYHRQPNSDYTTWPFDQPFYLIVNLAIGGIWGGMDKSHHPNGIDNSSLPASLVIQGMYYYNYIDPSAKK